jgi:hypothetical protein
MMARAYRWGLAQNSSGGVYPVSNERVVRIVAHRQNISRYKALLKTELTTIERDFIDRRIAEESAEIRRLAGDRRAAS